METLRAFKKSDTASDQHLSDCVSLTQREVLYVRQTSQDVAEFQLRRLTGFEGDDRRGQTRLSSVISLDAIRSLHILPLHRELLYSALSIQLHAFSGGALPYRGAIFPLWISLMLSGNGLRRMASDTSEYAARILRLLGPVDPTNLAQEWVTDPWKAYRLGMFDLATLLTEGNPRASDLGIRIQLATNGFEGLGVDQLGSSEKIGVLSSAIAYAVKLRKPIPETAMAEVEAWIEQRTLVTSDLAPLVAQAMNAVNLVLLSRGDIDRIDANMRRLLSDVTPGIGSSGSAGPY